MLMLSPAGTPTPVATVTPGPGACAGGEDVVVVVAIDEGYGSARVDLAYPAAVNIPGSGSGSDVAGRVAFAPSGIKVVNDFDDDGDLADDTLTASLVSIEDNPAGTFVTVTFDCVAGQSAPAAGQFTCTVVSAATGGGSLIDPPPGCSVTVQ